MKDLILELFWISRLLRLAKSDQDKAQLNGWTTGELRKCYELRDRSE